MPRNAAKKHPRPVDAYVGARIRLRRNLAGISQTEMGCRIGVTFQQVQKYERGTNRIGASRLMQICAVLEVTPAWLFEGAPGPQPQSSAAARKIDNETTAFDADQFAPQLMSTFPRLSARIKRSMVALMTAVADETTEPD